MAVHFSRGRMHVGYRQMDWSDVWYEPIGERSKAGDTKIGLFQFVSGDPGAREPMNGEVLWHPPFDVANCESKNKKERQKKQRQFLNDAYRYLNETDPEKVLAMEVEFQHYEGFSRWNCWFRHAMKWKKARMQKRKRMEARQAGVNEEDIRLMYESDDSTYDSDNEGSQRWWNRANAPKPPPGRPTSGENKRKTATDHVDHDMPNPKVPRMRAEDSSGVSNGIQFPASLFLGSEDND